LLIDLSAATRTLVQLGLALIPLRSIPAAVEWRGGGQFIQASLNESSYENAPPTLASNDLLGFIHSNHSRFELKVTIGPLWFCPFNVLVRVKAQ
jgi:hypothetical protein